ncbi:hypothetical protein TWF481_010469 [Arthrobotrys musiformis]|uniref:Mitochondrial division protein 1 n=1 Tax=Arthrobotrys musiformis TaxID=47236 RepID=A0AAV9W0W1_9PEZI
MFSDDPQVQFGASFFFKRGESERDNASLLFTTIAVELSRKVPGLAVHIKNGIQEEPDISKKSLDQQFKYLIFQPLQKLNETAPSSAMPRYNAKRGPIPLILVMDALDECQDEDRIRLVLHLFSEVEKLKPNSIHVRVFLTSRPELPIRLGFKNMAPGRHHCVKLQDIPPTTIQGDISIFLKEEFAKIAEDSEFSPEWPGSEVITMLTNMAIPLFIFAATMCRFVRGIPQSGSTPKRRLETILKYGASGGALSPTPDWSVHDPKNKLDQTYLPVLEQFEFRLENNESEYLGSSPRTQAWRQLCKEFRAIIGTIVILADPLSTCALAHLLGILEEEVDDKLRYLHSVLDVPSKSQPSPPIRLPHLSFRDFLVDPEKGAKLDSKRIDGERIDEINGNFWFWINEKEAHSMLMIRCVDVLSENLKKYICCLKYPGMPRKELSASEIDKRLPSHLQYACRYWIKHLKHSSEHLRDEDAAHIYGFLRKHFLYWLETLSLLGRLSECVSLINTLRELVDKKDESELSRFLSDAKRFVLQSWQIIDKAPLQVYSSALIFAPQKSLVRSTFQDDIPGWIRRQPKTPEAWGPLLQSLDVNGGSGNVQTVAFSPDGRLLVSGDSNSSICLWVPETGEHIRTLEGHTSSVAKVAFSFDGKYLASASYDNTVRIWDVVLGQELEVFKGHTAWVIDFAFSPDGKLLASASVDRTIRLWDAVIERQITETEQRTPVIEGRETATRWQERVLQCHTDWVEKIAYSPDGKLLVSASTTSTITLWDPKTGGKIKVFSRLQYDYQHSLAASVAFSPDGKQVASAFKNTVIFWCVMTGQQLQKYQKDSIEYWGIAFSPTGKDLASATDTGTIELWDVATGRGVTIFGMDSGTTNAVTFSPDGKVVASASGTTIALCDAAIEQWMEHAKPQLQIAPQETGASSKRHEKKGRSLWSNTRPTLRHIAIKRWRSLTLRTNTKTIAKTTKGQLSRPGSSLGKEHHPPKILASAPQELSFETGNSPICRITYSPETGQVASGSSDGTITLWDPSTGRPVKCLRGHTSSITELSFCLGSENATRLLASGSSYETVRVWDTTTGQQIQIFEKIGWIGPVSFISNGQELVIVALGTISFWNVATGQKIRSFELLGFNSMATAMAFYPNEERLVLANYRGEIIVLEAATGKELQRFKIGNLIEEIRFSDKNGHLQTDKGVVVLPPSLSSSSRIPLKSSLYTYRRDWISRDGQKFLWLPPDFRGMSSVLGEGLFAIGRGSGEVSFFGFADENN